jgi:predicted lipid-binding transport protein (Tim44 family)
VSRRLEGPRGLAGIAGLAALVGLAALLLPEVADARVGGGHSYSSGGGSSSSGSGSSSSGGEAAVARLLIWLILENPVIGIPVTIVVVGGYAYVKLSQSRSGDSGGGMPSSGGASGHHAARPRPAPKARRAGRAGVAELVQRDPNFSEPLFLDLVHLIFIRAHEARSKGDFSHLTPFLSEQARAAMAGRKAAVSEVVVGACAPTSLRISGDTARFVVEYEANVTEDGKRIYSRERWTFHRKASAHSPGPDRMQALRCPSCGNAVETKPDGTCSYCETPITSGELQWQAEEIAVIERRPVRPPHLQLGGGPEPGIEQPTRQDPALQANLRALRARHPDFNMEDFKATVGRIFHALQDAWATLDWEKARPYQTDRLYQANRYWIENYKSSGLRNHLEDISIDRVVLARITLDAWYESITVRVYARMKDWTTDASGKVVGGSDKQPKIFSEYWTFVRSSTKAREAWDGTSCPSCGAPLDRVSETGVCGYCDSKVSSGQFSWVLSAITQDESYRG